MTTTHANQQPKNKTADAVTVNVLTVPRTREVLDRIGASFAKIPAKPVLDQQEFRAELRKILADAYKRGGLRKEMEERLKKMGFHLPMSFYKSLKPVRSRSRQEALDSNGEYSVPANAFTRLSRQRSSKASQ